MTLTPPEPPTHQCRLLEESNWAGRRMLSPCTICGRPASEIMDMIRGDKIRRLLREFLAEAPRFMAASVGAQNTQESDRWYGQALARGELFDRLKEAEVDMFAAPMVSVPGPPAPRHAQAVRDLHVLSVIDDGNGWVLSSCKADGYISDDLETDPCPTLAALNQTDPPPVRPIVDTNKLAAEIFDALNAALGSGLGDTGWSMIDESRRLAESIADHLPTVNLENPVIVKAIGRAIASPGTFVPRQGSVPDHQVHAVVKALRDALS
jgi:hypothetical protein